MDTKDQLGSSVGIQNNGDMDRFPDGMRVLAVDDDLTYLKFLEAGLRKCNYEVTTANHAYKALQILRENRNKFDLLISDVQMPDMDGFQLLQLLGNEMDLPVIMVSGDGDTELMKKGISHGACCYLVKPVDIEVFKTIWQHVFREKRLNAKDQSKSSDQEFQDKVCNGKREGEEGISAASSSDQNGEHKIKRKHQNEDDEGGEHDEDENEEPSAQKKRRLNCTDDQNGKHKIKRKHQDEDDEGGKHDEDESEKPSARKKPRFTWTDEIHRRFLDAYYRLGPDKAVPKAMVAVMNIEGLSRANVASHLQKFREQLKKGSINQNGRASMAVDLRRKDSYMPSTGAVDESGGRLSNPAPLSSIPPQMLSGSNSPPGFSMRRIYPSSHLMRPGKSQIFCNSINNVANFQVLPNQSQNHFQVSPAPAQLNQNSTIDIGQFSASNNGPETTFPYERLPHSSLGYERLPCTSTVQGNPQRPFNPKYFDNALRRSSNDLNNNEYGESWQGSKQGCGQLCQFPPTSGLRSADSYFGQLPTNNLGFSSSTPQFRNSPNDFSSCHIVPTMYSTTNQWWEDPKQDYNTNRNLPSIVFNNGILDSLSQTLDQNDAVSSRSTNSSLFVQNDGVNKCIVQCLEVQNSTMLTKIDSNEDCILLEQAKSNDGLVQNSLESLDNQVQLDQSEFNLLDEEFGFDAVQDQNANGEYDLLDGGFGGFGFEA